VLLAGCGGGSTPAIPDAPGVPEAEGSLDPRLIAAVRADNLAEVDSLLERGADPDATAYGTHDGDTVLITASRTGNLETSADRRGRQCESA
jgi:hypothetical protein